MPVGLVVWALAGCGPPWVDPSDESGTPYAAASAAGALAGHVRDAEGPVAGAFVTVRAGGWETTTDADGRYAFPRLPPGPRAVIVASTGHATAVAGPVEVVADADAELDVALEHATALDGWLTVAVTAPAGHVASGTVTVSPTEPPGAPVTGALDGDGVARFGDLAGATVDVRVDADDLTTWSARDVTVPARGNRELAIVPSGRTPTGSSYVGPDLCAFCHTDLTATHAASRHARAATSEPPTAVAAAFDAGAVIALDGAGGPTATLGRSGADEVITLRTPAGDVLDLTVTRWIGADGTIPWVSAGDDGFALPLGWVADGSDPPGFPDGARWVPWRTDAWFDATGELDRTDGSDLPAAADDCGSCHLTGPAGAEEQLGVQCEACHGPALGHTSSTRVLMPDRIVNPGRLDADAANDACGRCHGGPEGTPAWPAGHAAEAGHQAEELARSAHGDTTGWTQTCADCHAPHGSAHTASLRLESADDGLCLSCHAALSALDAPSSVAAHTQHADAACTGCHMPATAARIAFGPLSGAGDVASHRFTVVDPADAVAAFGTSATAPLGTAPPHGCQQCHAAAAWEAGTGFPGPVGDPTQRATHEAHADAFTAMFP